MFLWTRTRIPTQHSLYLLFLILNPCSMMIGLVSYIIKLSSFHVFPINRRAAWCWWRTNILFTYIYLLTNGKSNNKSCWTNLYASYIWSCIEDKIDYHLSSHIRNMDDKLEMHKHDKPQRALHLYSCRYHHCRSGRPGLFLAEQAKQIQSQNKIWDLTLEKTKLQNFQAVQIYQFLDLNYIT